MSNGFFGERFVGMREPGWRAVGQAISADQQLTVEEALKVGKIDFTYETVPVGFTTPDGAFQQSGKKVAVLRSPTSDDNQWRELGVVNEGYKFLQNDELARGLDAIAQRTGWKFETVGALGHGETIFMTLDAGERTVKGDPYKSYLLVSEGKTTNRALTISSVALRVICSNTLIAAEAGATVKIKVAHTDQVAKEYGFWLNYISDIKEAQNRVFSDLDKMASTKITDAVARRIITEAFPDPTKNQRARQAEVLTATAGIEDEAKEELMARLSGGVKLHDYWVKVTEGRRDAAFILYDRFNNGDEQGIGEGGEMEASVLAKIKKTPYACLQAITELSDWGQRGGDSRSAGINMLFGEGARLKQRAWSAALDASR